MKRLTSLMAMASVAALSAGGCGCGSVQKQNQKLTQRVAELEDQLEQADAIISAATTGAEALVGGPVYIIVEGDSLWGIAKKQFGSGTRYKEIMALNRHITKDNPLTIGTKLKMPLQ